MWVAVAVVGSNWAAGDGGYMLQRECAGCGGVERLLESGFGEGGERGRGRWKGTRREVWEWRWTTWLSLAVFFVLIAISQSCFCWGVSSFRLS